MKKNSFTKVMLTGLIIFGPLFIFSMLFLNPQMGVAAITTALVSLFFLTLCLVALIGYLFRVRVSNNEVLFIAIKTSLRQGFLFSLYLIGILGLAAIRLLTWWDALLLALSLFLFEIYFNASKETR